MNLEDRRKYFLLNQFEQGVQDKIDLYIGQFRLDPKDIKDILNKALTKLEETQV